MVQNINSLLSAVKDLHHSYGYQSVAVISAAPAVGILQGNCACKMGTQTVFETLNLAETNKGDY